MNIRCPPHTLQNLFECITLMQPLIVSLGLSSRSSWWPILRSQRPKLRCPLIKKVGTEILKDRSKLVCPFEYLYLVLVSNLVELFTYQFDMGIEINFIFIYQVGIYNCQNILWIMGMTINIETLHTKWLNICTQVDSNTIKPFFEFQFK